MMNLTFSDRFADRHIGPSEEDQSRMLELTGAGSMEELIDQTIPASIRTLEPPALSAPHTEHEYLEHLKTIADKNRCFRSYIGMGYHPCITPSVIRRNVLENPGWYTPYTPYQAEIAQGRLEALFYFQTMVSDLTGLEIANASLLDEATAAAEAMTLMNRVRNRRRKDGGRNAFLVSDRCFPQTLDVLRTRAEPLGIELRIQPASDMEFTESVFGALLQSPDDHGEVHDLREITERARESGAMTAVGADLLALTLTMPPGEMGADIAFGNAQRFGVAMGFGGPHAAFFATRDALKREVPGRIIGLSVDAHGRPAYRMALQTREQHIRREKATSNICTAQALLANMSAFYAIYHGPEGLRNIADRVHRMTCILDKGLSSLGYRNTNKAYFDTLRIHHKPDGSREGSVEEIRKSALKAEMNFRYFDDGHIGISLNETTRVEDLRDIISVFAEAAGAPSAELPDNIHAEGPGYPGELARTSSYLEHQVFNSHRSETQMMRYLKKLERKDIGLDTSMIPLGSCTMKLNAAAEMTPVTWPQFSDLHPFAPLGQAEGYMQIFRELEDDLCKITGFTGLSLQPNAGAQGEYAGLLAIREWHRGRGEGHRNVALIPASAHGTNPASAVLAGMKVVIIDCNDNGYVNLNDLKTKAEQYRDTLSALMITYPSTYGVFEEHIREICDVVHACGGQVYMDGANMNAQTGLTSPERIGADVCHLNLHKTFAIPHGGGGPGMGPIAVASHLKPYLPRHHAAPVGGEKGAPAVSAAPWGSSSILLISHACIRMLGSDGLAKSAMVAILNANYVKARLEEHFPVHYTGDHNRVAHELIFDLRPLTDKSGVNEQDVAKRLMDYGFHAPTVSWPVPGTMMIEPTECESKEELDRFCDAMIAIRGEIQSIIDGESDPDNNPLKNAPHTGIEAASDTWDHPYSRQQAVFPLPFVYENKFWPSVSRIDNAHGDRHLICSCPPVEEYR